MKNIDQPFNRKRAAFTLAEILITLAIIGVVAAITLPSFVDTMTERKNSEREANIAQKITQAMEHMRATGKLIQYSSTEDFVNELKHHIKISKICDNNHLTDCFTTDTVIGGDGKEYSVDDAKTGEQLGLGMLTTTNNVGIVLADGASLILNYDNTTSGLDVGDRVSASNKDLPVGGGKTKNFPYTTSVTSAIDYVTDVNGKSKPNKEVTDKKYYDIRSFKGASFSRVVENGRAGKILYLGTSYEALDCSSSKAGTDDYEKYCKYKGHPSGYLTDYWAGAIKVCEKYGMVLPTISKLQTIYQYKSDYTSIASLTDGFWSSQEDPSYSTSNGRPVFFNNGYPNSYYKGSQHKVVCSRN